MNTSFELLTTHAAAIGWALLHSLWQGALAAAALFLTLALLRRRSAALRHAACLLALLAMTFLTARTAWQLRPAPVASIAMEASSAIPVSETATHASEPAATSHATLPGTTRRANREDTTPAPAVLPLRSWRERVEPWLPWICALWLAGVAGCALRHCGGWWRVRASRKHGSPARPEWQQTCARLVERFGLRRGVRLLESADPAGPMLAGLFKPVVLLPARLATGLSAAEIEAILAHELAHLARRDAWSNFAQVAIETLFFYHPAVWWIGHCARQERENAADDLALRVCTDRRTYANALAQLAELRFGPPPALAATGGSLVARIRRIVRPDVGETACGGWSLALLAPVIVLLASSLWLARVNADEAKAPAVAATAAPPAETLQQLAERAAKDAKPWLDDAFQIDDKAKRDAAIERIRAAMSSHKADEARAGVTAFVRLGVVEFDKASFRPSIRKLLGSPDAATRAAAASAISSIGAEPEDTARLLAMADDPAPEVRETLTGVIVWITQRDVTGKAASDAILKLMANLPRDSRMVAHALWGVKLSPEVEARVLEFCRDIDHASNGSIGYNFFYGTLSTQANKSEASCRRLIELLAHQDTTNIAGRSAWGLQQGVARAQYPLLAEAMMKVVESRSDGYLRDNALRCLRTYGSAEQLPAIRALLAKPGVSGDFRKLLEETAASFEPRTAASAVPAAESKPAPTASASPPATQGVVLIAADGAAKWNGRELSPEALGVELKARAQQSADFAVTVRAAKDADYQSVLKILDLCREANVQKVAFAADASPAEGNTPAAGSTTEETQRVAKLVETNRQAARLRAAQDQRHYDTEQLGEIETLYQVANTKGKRSEEARASLKKLLEKYDKANRTGCATLYLGQASEGAERLEYLTRAVEKFSDCYYFNGCQVGGYGRYVLALLLWEKGEKDKARTLIAELKTTYKEATGHNGRPMSEFAESAENSFAAQP